MIKLLNENITEELCAQQVITSLPDCIKQLIQNSIDANSTKIKILLQDYGKKKVQVSDNGIGIDNFQVIGKKGSTSKNKGDMDIKTLGFRGQALNSIARVSQNMYIQSKIFQKPQTKKFIIKQREVKQSKKQITNGTIVTIEELFMYLPVRRQQLFLRFKEHLKQIYKMIKQYTIIYPEIGFTLVNLREGKNQILIDTVPHSNWSSKTWKQRLLQILGDKIVEHLVWLQSEKYEGWILDKIQSGSVKQNSFVKDNMKYLYLNRRPIDLLPSLINIFDSYYKKYSSSAKYIFVINLKLQNNDYDVNLTPNKRQILIRKNVQEEITSSIKKDIQNKIVEGIPSLQDFQIKKSQTINNTQTLKNTQTSNNTQHSKVNFSIKNIEREPQIIVKDSFAIKKQIELVEKKQVIQEKFNTNKIKTSLLQSLNQKMGSKKSIKTQKVLSSKNSCIENQQRIQNTQKLQKPNIKVQQQNPLIISQQLVEDKPEIEKQNQKLCEELKQYIPSSIKKQNFKDFQIMGQFNTGFIVCKYNQSFYLVDQHAASEKTKFQSYLNHPKFSFIHCVQKMEINTIMADALQTTRQQLQRDGYQFTVLKRKYLTLEKYPIIMDKTFGKSAFLTIVQKGIRLRQLPEFRNLAASKACRNAVMVGDILSLKQMMDIVQGLANLQSPWNCPHGRPTTIQLGNIVQLQGNTVKNDSDKRYCL